MKKRRRKMPLSGSYIVRMTLKTLCSCEEPQKIHVRYLLMLPEFRMLRSRGYIKTRWLSWPFWRPTVTITRKGRAFFTELELLGRNDEIDELLESLMVVWR